MTLDEFPNLRVLSAEQRLGLATDLFETVLDEPVELHPDLLAALEERLAYYHAHPHEVFTTEEVTARLAALKKKIAARRVHA